VSSAVSVRIWGGLGNQLFQYAAARSLADRLGVPLLLDTQWFAGQSLRQPELSHFKIRCDGDMARQAGSVRTVIDVLSGRLVRQHRNDPVPSLLTRKRPAHLAGYFQSESYFAANATRLREDVSLCAPLSPAAEALQRIISAQPTVSVHVRRSDYLTAKHLHTFAAVEAGYYAKAAAGFAGAAFMVFSDDITWCRDNLRLPGPVTFAEGTPAHEDLMLMAACRHHIIANSTFSWWGAWLNPRTDKQVCAPRNWFVTPKLQTAQLLCPGFVLFDNA
jgi:hypothetical protein